MATNFNLPNLIDKYLAGNCTPAEKAEVETWFEQHRASAKEFYNDDAELVANAEARSLAVIKNRIAADETATSPAKVFKLKRAWPWMAAASVVLAAGLWLFPNANVKPPDTVVTIHKSSTEIAPGGNKAILTLSNGQKIILDSANNGTIAKQGNQAIHKTADGQIDYSRTVGNSTTAELYNTMATPVGGVYTLTLSDGTQVTLDAQSSITYPVVFTGKQRQVKITGQAYFKVTHNAAMPFSVSVNDQTIEDLGTEFNINAYTATTTTTLIKGLVRVNYKDQHVTIKPGKFVANVQDKLMVADADTDEETAWKYGLFVFNNESITSIMQQVARWYDVDVNFKGNVKDINFIGNYSRNKSLTTLLKNIESTERVKFLIEGRRITVIAK